ncbi:MULTISPECIES: cytochrome c peroxidase [unclassified Spirosoma]|uniref:cytochrome-c peroxidase n=1 Tax=unclassified Spirosoma TaxID=2621999 RepID=UPI0009688A38|nr:MULTISPECIES: cytochrome c peroxidase [unclassified Spirosoma]MBN8826145.1 cytochrome-c peroxidase [Spirosoma sp.]OJW74627.1 MAG: cytochrome-c peroxidase [Spirosoma sp. 48-14]
MKCSHLISLLSIILFIAVVLDACTKEDTSSSISPLLNTPTVTASVSNPITNDTALLGQALFWDPILSGNKDIACATCHHPNNAYTDGLDLSLGTNAVGLGQNRQFRSPNDIPVSMRNAPTLLNVALNGMDSNGKYDPSTAPMFWDSRTQSLENQSIGPLSTFEEMRGHAYSETLTLDSLVARLSKITEYQQLFQKAFGSGQTITASTIRKAIATFERTLVAMNSPYDRYLKGEKTALNDQQLQGMFIFKDEGCAICHAGPMFSDYKLHVLSVPDNPKRTSTDAGAAGTYAFRTPSLRNVGMTAPYMHNGTFKTLKQVLKFYDDIGEPISQNPNVTVQQLDPKIQRIALRDAEQDQLIAFLNALTDPSFNQFIPDRVPSGLHPGGNIR